MKKEPYTCPRCGLTTKIKYDMRRHLFLKKKPCPAQKDNIELTEDIKNFVLDNRIYHPPNENKVINNYIQNINTINNFIANIDDIDKLMKFNDYTRVELLSLDQTLENKFVSTTKRLECDRFKYGFELNKDDLFDVIDQVSNAYKFHTFQDLNIYYDKKMNKLKIYDGEWEEMLTEKGLKKIIETIQSCYWDEYECYLLRRLHNADIFMRQRCKELIDEYYKFIGAFELPPYCKNKSNIEILGESEGADEYALSDEYYGKYMRIVENTKKGELKTIKKNVLDIIKVNSARNIDELNKKVFELFSSDEAFKSVIIPASGSVTVTPQLI